MSEIEGSSGELEGGSPDELTKQEASDLNVVAKGGAVQIAGQVSQRGLSFFFQLVATRVLGPAGYGLYRLVNQMAANLAQLGLMGFNYAGMRFVAKGRAIKDPSAVKGAIWTSILGTIVSAVVVVSITLLAARPIADFFTERDRELDELVRLLRIASPYIILYALLQTIRYCTQAYKTMVPSVTAGNIVQPMGRFLIGVVVLAVGGGVAGIITALNVSVLIAIFVAAWWLRRLMTAEEKRARPRFGVGPMVRFAVPQSGASLLGVQTLGLSLLILGHYDTNFAVGLFAIALSLQGPGNVFLGGIVNIWAPVVTDLYDKGAIDRLGSLYQTINRWIATFSFPVFAALIIEPDLFVDLFAGSKGQGAVSVVAILAIGNIFYTGTGPTGYVISMTGHPGVNFLNSIVSVSLYITLGVLIVPEHGIVGMAWVDVGVTALVNTVRVIEAKMLVGIQPFGKTFYKPILATLAGAAALLLWHLIPGDNIPLDLAGIALGATVYVYVLKALGLDEEERHVLDRIRSRAFKRGKR